VDSEVVVANHNEKFPNNVKEDVIENIDEVVMNDANNAVIKNDDEEVVIDDKHDVTPRRWSSIMGIENIWSFFMM